MQKNGKCVCVCEKRLRDTLQLTAHGAIFQAQARGEYARVLV